MSTLELLFENEIPAGRQALQDSHHNLQDVANYCEDNYLKSPDKRRALEETKNFTTQSLASVAYQINTLATSMLQMLDLQATQMANMESSINHIAQNVAIHKEKVARREIGVLTTNKNCPRTHKVITPANPEKQAKYKSAPIDYGILDDVGHGLKLSSPSSSSGRSRADSQASTNTTNSGGYEALPIYQPSREENPYNSMRRRMPNHPPVAPTVPPQYHSISRAGPRPPDQGAPPPSRDRPSIHAYMQAPPGPGQGGMGVPAAPPPPPSMAPGGMPPPMTHAQGAPPPPPNMGPPPAPPFGGMAPPQAPQAPHMAGMIPPAPPVGGMVPPAPPMGGMVPQQMAQAPPPPPATHPEQTPQPPPMSGFAAQLNQAIHKKGPGVGAGDAQRGSLNPYGEIGLPPPPADMGAGDLPPPPMEDNPYMHEDVTMPPPPEFEQTTDELLPGTYIEKVLAVYDYMADRDDELTFEEGATIFVLKKNEDGWYEGVCEGRTGLFPGNYVELSP